MTCETIRRRAANRSVSARSLPGRKPPSGQRRHRRSFAKPHERPVAALGASRARSVADSRGLKALITSHAPWVYPRR